MKTVGVILREWKSKYKEYQLYAVKTDLIAFLRKYNINVIAIPVVFENTDELNNVKRLIDLCDGVILPGGAEINDIDYKITEYLYSINKPTLGICLGMQIIGKTFNGQIREKIENGGHNKNNKYVHDIVITKDSLLYKILGETTIKVNSRHENYVPQTKLDCVAYSQKDNILEAIEDKSKKFFIGVQWHPESLNDDIYSNRLFDYFIKCL